MKDVDVLILVGVALCIGLFVAVYLPWIFIRGKAATYDPYDKLPDEGVNGWLLLMLVQVFSITPIYSSIQFLALLKTVNELRSQAFTNFAYSLVALTLAIIILAWKFHLPLITTRSRKAVSDVKRIYLLLPVASTLGFYLCSVMFLESTLPSVHRASVSELPRLFFSSAFGAAIWYWYLSKSKRVAVTYRHSEAEMKKSFSGSRSEEPSWSFQKQERSSFVDPSQQGGTFEPPVTKPLKTPFEEFPEVRVSRYELETAAGRPFDRDLWQECLSRSNDDEVAAMAQYRLRDGR